MRSRRGQDGSFLQAPGEGPSCPSGFWGPGAHSWVGGCSLHLSLPVTVWLVRTVIGFRAPLDAHLEILLLITSQTAFSPAGSRCGLQEDVSLGPNGNK